ncbi:MAG: hypothetical protein CL610_23790 [Anaerolineaceae bacterium]|nr:hypothetical protein [Anaerolineaceae bacterium]
MPLFIVFIFGSVVVGAGAMLAPAWPTQQPRIGLSAAMALGVVIGGSLFWSMLFGWNTLVIDYLLFALVTAIFLGGTLSYGQMRAEERGEELLDADQGWPGPLDLAFFGMVALVFMVPTIILPVPLDTDAQGFGYLALMARLGGSFDTLAPFNPEITYLYAPGFTLLTAYLSEQLGQGLHHVQFGVAAVLGLLNVWLAYDLGSEIRDKRLGRALAVAMLAGLGLFTAFMDSHFTSLLGLAFALAFIILVLRYLRNGHRADAVGAGLMLGAVVISHPDTTVILALGYVPWLLTMWLGQPKPTLQRWLVLALGVPLLALLAISPWLLAIRDHLGSEVVSPFLRSADYLRTIIVFHGVWTIPVAVIGAMIGLRQRTQAFILAVGWLLFIVDAAVVGLVETLLPWLPIYRYDYPFSIAWHGPIIPFTILAGFGLLWLYDRKLAPRMGRSGQRYAWGLLAAGAIILLGVLVFSGPLLQFSKGRINFFGAFASHDDVQAMAWLRENTPAEARVLNFPGTNFDNSHEGDWVPVISERDSVYYRWQPFFQNTDASLAEQDALRTFWQDPADPAHADLLREHDIDYVIVPQIVGNRDSLESAWRWNTPFAWELVMQSAVADAPYLRPVFEADGAQVYEVIVSPDEN